MTMRHKQVNLRKSLARRQLQPHMEYHADKESAWSGHMDIWEEGLRAIAAGWRPPRRMVPVVLGEGMFTTADMVKEVTGMPETPQVIKTSWCKEGETTKSTDSEEQVVVCEVPSEYADIFRRRAKEMTDTSFDKSVWMGDQRRFATIVYSMKEEWEEDNKEAEQSNLECILIGGEKGFPSPERVQELAEMKYTPEIIRTTWAPRSTGEALIDKAQEKDILICEIPTDKYAILARKLGRTSEGYVWARDEYRYLYILDE